MRAGMTLKQLKDAFPEVNPKNIAQRITTVINADQIFVMDKGEIVARGKHADLLEDNEIYAEIYSSQLLGEEHAEIRS